MAECLSDGALSHLSPPDRARAQRLTLDTLRSLPNADRLLKPHLKKRPPLAVQNILRLGTHELMSGEAAHGVINSLVDITGRNRRTASLKGLVNAVLRKIAATDAETRAKRGPPRLPRWLRDPLTTAWGGAAIKAMEAAHARGAPLDLTARDDPQAVAEMTGGTLLPTGSIRLTDPGQVSALPGYADGAWWVQDAAAALPARLLAPHKGERVLDLCAAPGGKTLQLAAMGADVTAIDISEPRMARVTDNLARTGLQATTLVADALEFATPGWDAILLDAPCSATGTIRRHPDLPHAKDGADFAALIAGQTRLIDHALALLNPGGRLTFCTCSLLPDEGEVQAEAALTRHPGLSVVPPALPGLDPAWPTPEGGLRLRPDHWADRGGLDGFYIVTFRNEA